MSASDSPPSMSTQAWDGNAAFSPAGPLDPALDAAPAHDPAHDAPGFFDSLLNPAFAYTRSAPYDMASSRPQPGRLSNGYVDLTSSHVDLTAPDSPPRRRKRDSPAPGPSSKRHKHDHGTSAERPHGKSPANMVEMDLSQDAALFDLLQRQREEALESQPRPEETVTTFNNFNCVICMDRPTDITATACGHLFCHTCLMEALIAGENRTGPGEPKRSQCPVCRKSISRTRATDIIPILLKKGLATQPRRKPAAMPPATAPKVH
ncbi:RING-type E3 ubiquitin transferase [Ascochyta rabiei]|uniref:RING-type E3 ubiquitin transferase n=1 Tax=Didymella rabiei TaxID=5454 RepID=UPI0019027B35|nr:RING-type E3 ubiquitin transferase [Ascochyta rabiei]UPX17581.1 RING-type E3 ubiquitin transferase [Ascochyta rabiei]